MNSADAQAHSDTSGSGDSQPFFEAATPLGNTSATQSFGPIGDAAGASAGTAADMTTGPVPSYSNTSSGKISDPPAAAQVEKTPDLPPKAISRPPAKYRPQSAGSGQQPGRRQNLPTRRRRAGDSAHSGWRFGRFAATTFAGTVRSPDTKRCPGRHLEFCRRAGFHGNFDQPGPLGFRSVSRTVAA